MNGPRGKALKAQTCAQRIEAYQGLFYGRVKGLGLLQYQEIPKPLTLTYFKLPLEPFLELIKVIYVPLLRACGASGQLQESNVGKLFLVA